MGRAGALPLLAGALSPRGPVRAVASRTEPVLGGVEVSRAARFVLAVTGAVAVVMLLIVLAYGIVTAAAS